MPEFAALLLLLSVYSFLFTFNRSLSYTLIKVGEIMKKRSNRKKNSLIIFIWALVLLISAIIFLESKIRPSINSIAEYQSRDVATQYINNTVYQTLSKNASDYSDFVKIKYDSLGQISSVETNTTEINKFQAEISKQLNEKYEKIGEADIPIKLGTLTGISYLVGHGPVINFKILPVGYVKTQLVSEFKEAGINQTIHQIKLNVYADAEVVLPGNYDSFEVEATYILTDTVIVGKIPDGYTYIAGDNRDNISKINDYNSNNGS